MPRLNTRKFRRDVRYATGSIAFTPPVTFTQASVDGVDIATALAGGHQHLDAGFIYVDSKRAAETYTETGTEMAPYRTLNAALTAKLGQTDTAYRVFKLLPGNYDGTVSIDKDAANQSFEIIGSGRDSTFIRGAASFSSATSHVLYFQDFLDITLKHLHISNGRYGFYPRSCRNIVIEDCEFKYLGSDGTENRHDQSGTMAEQAAFWASNQTSDGGTMRVRSCQDVKISNCRSSYCLRGFRIQDCTSGNISNCRLFKTLESGVYLASGTYTGAAGCTNFQINNVVCDSLFHSGFLIIGGHNTTITGCQVLNCASSAFNGWHTQDCRIIGCVAHNNNTKNYIGIGVLGDSYGQCYFAGATGITNTGGHILVALNNSFTLCGQGRADNKYAFYVLDNPGLASSRIIIDNNNHDATVDIHNPDNVPLVSTQYPAPPAPFSGTADRVVLTDGAGALTSSSVTNTVLSYLDATSSIQTQLDSLSGPFTGTGDRVVVTSGAGAETVSSITTTELNMLDGATSNLQDQLDNAGGVDLTNLNLTGKLDIDSSNAAVEMRKSGYDTTFKVQAGNNYGLIQYGGCKCFMVPENNGNGRIKFEGDVLQVPAHSSTYPPQNYMNSRGGFFYDTDNDRLMVRIGNDWRVVTTEAP